MTRENCSTQVYRKPAFNQKKLENAFLVFCDEVV
jgi:hypothetical protein